MQKLLCSTQTCQNHITYPIQTSKVLTVLSPKVPKTVGPSIPQVKHTPKLKYMRKYKAPSLASGKGAACHFVIEKRPRPIKKESERLNHPTVPPKACVQPGVVTTLEAGGWKTVKSGKATASRRVPPKVQKPDVYTSVKQERNRVIIELDEDSDGGFSCLLDEKGTCNWSN